MSVFSRRTIQRCLDENASFLTVEQVDRHVQLLNQCNRYSLAAEWEVVLLRAVSAIGTVVHEAEFKGNRRPDLFLSGLGRATSENTHTGSLTAGCRRWIGHLCDRLSDLLRWKTPEDEFIADVTVVSDKTIEKDNPYEYFREEFGRALAKKGMTLGGFDFQVDGEAVGEEYRDRKMTLHLPAKNDTRRLIKQQFNDFITAAAERPNSPHLIKVLQEGMNITVKYDPRSREVVTGGYPSYNIAYSLTRNPLANALKSKADQLRGTGYEGAKGIICCDGGCGIFTERVGGASHYGHHEIVQHFFQRNSSISFVVLIWIADVVGMWTGDWRRREIQSIVYTNTEADPALSGDVHQAIHAALRLLPKPIRTAVNAVAAVGWELERGGASFYGGWSMAGQQVKLSSRALTGLLAGQIDQERFFEDHGSRSFNVRAFFERQLAEGRMITELEIESNDNRDDDWIVIRFGEPDVATSAFQRRSPVRPPDSTER